MFEPKSNSENLTKDTSVTAFTVTGDGEQAARQIASSFGSPRITVVAGGLVAAVRLSGSSHFGDIVIVELKAALERADILALEEIAKFADKVVAVGPAIGVWEFRRLLAAGVADYISLPMSSGDEVKILPALLNTAPHSKGASRSTRCICVIGSAGGIGTTTLACNLATLAASSGSKRVALVDLDVHFGSAFIHFNIKPTDEFVEALMLPQRVDETFMTATMASPLPNLFLYSTEKAEGRSMMESFNFKEVMKVIRAHFDEVIVDVPRQLVATSPDIAGYFDDVLMLVSPGFGSLRNRNHLEELVSENNPSASILNVLSNAHVDAKLKESEITKSLGVRIDARVPFAPEPLAKASVQGQPVVVHDPKSAVSKAYKQLYTLLTPQQASRKSLVERIFR